MDLLESKRRLSNGDLENILDSVTKPLFPPYSNNFKIPSFVQGSWIRKKTNGLYIPILRNNDHSIISLGDQFNSIVMSKKRKKGLKSPYRHHRVYQFLSQPNGLSGHIVFDKALSETRVLNKGEVIKGMVYRFEVIDIDKKRGVFYCVPLAVRMGWEDFISCKYKK